jgi:hypothetical protein
MMSSIAGTIPHRKGEGWDRVRGACVATSIRRANPKIPPPVLPDVSTAHRKNIVLSEIRKVCDKPNHPASTRGTLGLSSPNVRRVAMDATARRRCALRRTVKPCGPDPPTLGSTLGSKSPGGMVAKKPGTPGRARSSRKAIAQGVPCDFRRTCVGLRAFLFVCTQGSGCVVHPAFPAPSVFLGRCRCNSPDANRVAGTRSLVIARSEADEAIHVAAKEEWIASLRSQ